MIARAERVARAKEPREDHYVHLHGVTWADYLRLLEIRGERSVPRLTYVEGTLEIMSPSLTHEAIKSYLGRLVEAWCLERGIEFTPYGQWTLKNKRDERGAEADVVAIERGLHGRGSSKVTSPGPRGSTSRTLS